MLGHFPNANSGFLITKVTVLQDDNAEPHAIIWNPGILKAKTGPSYSPGQPRLYSQTLSQNKQIRRNNDMETPLE